VEKEQREVSDEMPAVPAPDVPSRVNDEAEIAARRAQQEAAERQAQEIAAREQEEARNREALATVARKKEEEANAAQEEAKRQEEDAAAKAAQAEAKRQAEEARLREKEAAKLQANAENERRKRESEQAAIEAAKTPEQRTAEAEELARAEAARLNAEAKAAAEAMKRREEEQAQQLRKRQELEDMKGEGQFFIATHHGRSMVLEGMHARHFSGHNTFKFYHYGVEVGTASATAIYDIPAHDITEIHGVELHEVEHSNVATHVTPFAEGVHKNPHHLAAQDREKRAAEAARNRPKDPPPQALPPRVEVPPPAAMEAPAVQAAEMVQEEEELLM
jgi:hypothetical protein